MDIQEIKQRFGIIGNAAELNRAIEVAIQVAPTDLSVLISGESGVGKESFPQIIHSFSHRKHAKFIAINCGAIPEGTIDSELFGHEKGSFTGALTDRKGYFEMVDGGTLFLDEIGELPISTQVRLLRVLESGEFIRVGSSQVQKTNVRVIAATNVELTKAIREGQFREDLYYRLNTVPIKVVPLRERSEDVLLLFRKFASDFAEKYKMPPIRLTEEAQHVMLNYRWPGNVRQLKNITEQISIIELAREITAANLIHYLPSEHVEILPALYDKMLDEKTFSSEREILYKILFDMKKDMNDLKKLVHDLMPEGQIPKKQEDNEQLIRKIYRDSENDYSPSHPSYPASVILKSSRHDNIQDTEEFVEESLSLEDKEIEMISKSLDKHTGSVNWQRVNLGFQNELCIVKLKNIILNNR